MHRLYTQPGFPGSRFLLLDGTRNEGAGAVLCRVHENHKKVRLMQVPHFLVEGCSEEFVILTGVEPLIKKTDMLLSLEDAVSFVRIAVVKWTKASACNMALPEYHKHVLRIALVSLNNAACECTSIDFLKYHIRVMQKRCGHIHQARSRLDILLHKEAEIRGREKAATVLQRAWRHANTDPAYMLCTRRLLYEFRALKDISCLRKTHIIPKKPRA